MSFFIVHGKTSFHSNHIRQEVDMVDIIKYDGRREYLLYPLITTQAFLRKGFCSRSNYGSRAMGINRCLLSETFLLLMLSGRVHCESSTFFSAHYLLCGPEDTLK